MNETLNDIQSLEKVRNILSNVPYSIDICTSIMILDDLIKQKDDQVKQFEKQAPQDIQDLCTIIRGGK